MKGIVLTEFIDTVEARYGIEVVDKMVQQADLESEGAFTSVGSYDHRELFKMLTVLSEITGKTMADLMKEFGVLLFKNLFATKYSALFAHIKSSIDFFENIDGYIHVEVAKLYPDAELPKFEYRRTGPNTIEMIYRSRRKMSMFAEGLMLGCAEHLNEKLNIEKEDLSGDGTVVRFVVEAVKR